MSWNGRKMTKPIGMGDIKDAVNYGSLDLGALIANGIIRPMAKYKPVRHSAVGILNETQRAERRYGFGTISDSSLPQLPMSEAEPKNDWVYKRPRGIGDNEWYRMLDFDGYVNDACHPLVLSVEKMANDGMSVIVLYGDDRSNGVRSDGKSWASGESLSLSELLTSASDYTGHYIAFLLCNGNKKNLIVTNKTMAQFITNPSQAFYLYTTDTTDSGVTYPSVPLLASSKPGDKVTVIACLAATSLAPTSSSRAYNVYSDVGSYTLYSLGFVAGCDRASEAVTTSAFTLDGVDFSLTVSATNMTTEIYMGGLYWRAYRVSVTGTFNNPVGWSPTDLAKTLGGTISITNGGGYVFGSTPTSGNNTISANTSADLYPYASGQTRTLYTAGSDKYLWIPLSGAGGTPYSTSITAEVIMTTPLTNSITRTASLTL